jgi:zinc/manganese transport system permease protein
MIVKAASSFVFAADPFTGIGHMLSQPFMRHAFVAGGAIAVAAGLVGYFLVLRSQLFSGDALSPVAFTGAVAALAAGLDARVGLFAATIGVALLIGLLGTRGRPDDVVIGSVFVWVLGLGVLVLSLYTRHRSGGNSSAGVSVLFGSVFGLDHSATVVALVISAATIVAMMLIARPLLFASVDEAVARARGVPVGVLGLAFLALVGVTAAQATQAVGALLLVGLLAAPAGAAYELTDRPFRAMCLSAAFALASMWVGLTISYAVADIPPSFAVIAVAAACFALSFARRAIRQRSRLSNVS